MVLPPSERPAASSAIPVASRAPASAVPASAVPPSREEMPSFVAEGDRRLYRRARLDRPVLLETSSRSGTARAVDVAAGGIALRTDLPLAPKERLSLYFELPIGYAVETLAEVVRCEGDLVALRFVDAPRDAVIAVRGFCRVSGLIPAIPAA